MLFNQYNKTESIDLIRIYVVNSNKSKKID